MQIAFILTVILGLAYFCLASRVFDWLAVGYGAASVYFLPGFFGYTRLYDDFEPISTKVYLVMMIVLGSILAVAFVLDSRQCDTVPAPQRRTFLPEAMTLLSLVGLTGAWLQSHTLLLMHDKVEMLDTFTYWHLVWQVGSMVAFVFAFTQQRWGLCVLSGASLLLLTYVGMRNSTALALIAVITLTLMQRGRRSLISNWRVFCAILLLVVFMFGYKQIYIFVKTGDYREAYARVAADDFLNRAVQNSEPFITQHILNVSVNTDFRIDPWEHAEDVVLASLTLGDKGEGITFGDKITYPLFGELRFGIASNIWAEMYSCAGMWGVFGFSVFFAMSLYLASSWAPRLDSRAVAILSSWMPFWAFYIHRNDSYRMLSFFRQFFGLLVLASLLAVVLSALRTSRQMPGGAGCCRLPHPARQPTAPPPAPIRQLP